jgi:hypothetical protein
MIRRAFSSPLTARIALRAAAATRLRLSQAQYKPSREFPFNPR